MSRLPVVLLLALLLGCPTASVNDDDATADDDDAAMDDDDVLDDDDAVDDDDAADDDDATFPQLEPLDLVTDATYSRIVVEIDYVEGHAPDAAALTAFEAAIDDLVDEGYIAKPQGFDLVLDDALPANADPAHVYTYEEQRDLSEGARSLTVEAGVAYLHMLYLDGRSEFDEGNQRVLGYAYGGEWIAMFRNNIDGACEGSTVFDLLLPAVSAEACSMTEAGVLTHEVGHLLGLVNNGLPMVADHQDEEHGAHDVNQDCLMYWLAETTGAADIVGDRYMSGETGFPPFDSACLADLAAASGR